jgi:hypothetical protein
MMLRGVGKGGVEWMQASATQREMEFLEGLQMSKQDIYDRLAPGLFSAMQTSALTNGENGLYLFAKYTIAPLLRELTDKLNCDILPTYGEGWTAEYENVVPEDKTLEMAQIEQYAKFHTVNEVRVEMFGNSPDPDPERGALFASQIAAKSSAPEVVPPVVPEIVAGEPAPMPEPMDAEPEQPEDDTVTKLMKHDLSNWKRKAIKAVGTDAASVFVSDYIPADILADIAAKIKECKTADDIAAAFKMAGTINKESTTDALPPSDKAIKMLAESINRMANVAIKKVAPLYNKNVKGGAGSGNFGHSGRPGEIGGSGSGDGVSMLDSGGAESGEGGGIDDGGSMTTEEKWKAGNLEIAKSAPKTQAPKNQQKNIDDAYSLGEKAKERGIESFNQAVRDNELFDSIDKFDFPENAAFEAGLNGREKPQWINGWRYGTIPDNGRSMNFAEGRLENGLSIMATDTGLSTQSMSFEMFGGSRRSGEKIYVSGFLNTNGTGGDGEPLLMWAKETGKVKN